jgi:hypothetical protein
MNFLSLKCVLMVRIRSECVFNCNNIIVGDVVVGSATGPFGGVISYRTTAPEQFRTVISGRPLEQVNRSA